ncbi:hypothetical protein ACFL18_01345, partial [Patescibacteria group bacterium]
NFYQKAIKKVAKTEYSDKHPDVIKQYIIKAGKKATELAEVRLNAELGDQEIDEETSKYNLQIFRKEELSKLIAQDGTPIPTETEFYNNTMNEIQIELAQTQGRHKVEKLQKKLSKQAEKKVKDRYMTQGTADKLDPSYLAFLQKMGKLKPEVIENASNNQKQAVDDFINNSPPEHINLPPANYANYSATDWSIFFQIFPDIAQQIFATLSDQNQQQIKSFFSA